MKEPTLNQIILDFVNHSNGWINKGEIYFESQRQGYSPEGGAREARRLAEQGKILVDYYKGKRGQRLAKYAPLNTQPPIKITREPRIVELANGQRVAISGNYMKVEKTKKEKILEFYKDKSNWILTPPSMSKIGKKVEPKIIEVPEVLSLK